MDEDQNSLELRPGACHECDLTRRRDVNAAAEERTGRIDAIDVKGMPGGSPWDALRTGRQHINSSSP
jgi:hypothetical protein